MLIDDRLEICSRFPLNTGAPGTYLISDVIDLSTVPAGDPGIYLVVMVAAAAASGGAATGTFSLVSHANSGQLAGGSATYHATSAAWPVAQMTAGRVLLCVPLPEAPPYARYLGLLQTTGGAAFTAGSVSAFLTTTPSTVRQYAAART